MSGETEVAMDEPPRVQDASLDEIAHTDEPPLTAMPPVRAHDQPTSLKSQLISPFAPKLSISHGPRFEMHSTLVGHTKGVSTINFSPDGRWLASGGADSVLLLYSIDERDDAVTFSRACEGHTGGINDVAWSPDSRSIATASDDRSIRIWLAETGGLVKLLRGHTSFVFCLDWSPDGNVLASGSFDETIRLWDVYRGTCLRSMPGHSDPISAVSFSSDATVIVSAAHDGLIRLWDTATGQCLLTLGGDTNPPTSHVLFSPNDRFLLAATLDSTLRLWNIRETKIAKTYTGHTNVKYCSALAWLHGQDDRTYIAAGSEDGKLVIWDAQTRERLVATEAHRDAVIAVAAHPTRPWIATAALERDATVKIWIDRSAK